MLRIALLALAVATSVAAAPAPTKTAAANPAAGVAADNAKRYQIELVIFENKNGALVGNERWTSEAPPLETTGAVAADDGLADDSKLASALTNLEKDSTYRVVTQKKWVQIGEEKKSSKLMLVQAGTELEGLAQFYVSRFLHIELDLRLRPADAPLSETGTPVVFRLDEKRRIKSQETHYFDHPKFGALVRVTPLKNR